MKTLAWMMMAAVLSGCASMGMGTGSSGASGNAGTGASSAPAGPSGHDGMYPPTDPGSNYYFGS